MKKNKRLSSEDFRTIYEAIWENGSIVKYKYHPEAGRY
jgi:hypothetical protein